MTTQQWPDPVPTTVHGTDSLKALEAIKARLDLTYRVCCTLAPKQAIGEGLAALAAMPEWDMLRAALASPVGADVASDERALFEAAMLPYVDLKRDSDDTYKFMGAHLAWSAWQARAALAGVPVQTECKWPNCMSEKAQQDLGDEVARELGIGVPAQQCQQAAPKLQVWYGAMPESNGKSNFTAILHAGDIAHGITLDRSEYPDRVRYEADRARYLIGELKERPFILDYDADNHSDYVAPAAPLSQPVVGEPDTNCAECGLHCKPGNCIYAAQPSPVSGAAEPKLILALPDYEKRRIMIASDEVIDGERLVCVAIKDAAGAPVQQSETDELAEWRRMKDPAVLYASLLKGLPTRLTPDQLRHIAGDFADAAGAPVQPQTEAQRQMAYAMLSQIPIGGPPAAPVEAPDEQKRPDLSGLELYDLDDIMRGDRMVKYASYYRARDVEALFAAPDRRT